MRFLVPPLAAGCLAAAGCGSDLEPSGPPDVTYEITEQGTSAVWLQYLKEAEPGDEPGKPKGAAAHQNATPPFAAAVRLGAWWRHAWIEAKTEPVDQSIRLHCVLKHNGTVLTEGDGMGGVSCNARSSG